MYCQHTMPHIPGPYIGMFHLYVPLPSCFRTELMLSCSWGSHVNVAFVLGWFFYVVFSDPGEVTKENVKFYLSKYHFDNVLYERVACKTCLIIRYFHPTILCLLPPPTPSRKPGLGLFGNQLCLPHPFSFPKNLVLPFSVILMGESKPVLCRLLNPVGSLVRSFFFSGPVSFFLML